MLATILVSRRPVDHVGSFNETQPNLKSTVSGPQLVRIPVTLLPLTSGLDADMLCFTHDDLADVLLCCTAQPPPANT